ncbi:MAG: hypothetical protein QW123_04515 [Desulfurococcaceae archaeon]
MKICAEIVGSNCRVCFEVENCLVVHELVRKTALHCRLPVDFEAVAAIVNGKIVDVFSKVCTDTELRIVRLLRGGFSKTLVTPNSFLLIYSSR